MVASKELRRRARNRLKQGNYWNSFAVSLVGSLISSVLALFTAGAVNYGVKGYYIRQQRGEQVAFADMFDGFNEYGKTFVANLLMWVFLTLWGLIPIAGIIIGGIVKPFSYSMTYYVMRDYGLEANDFITKSREMMNGYKFKLFCLRLSFIGWILLSALTCGIGFLFLAPYMEAAEAEFYAELTVHNS